MVNEFKIVTIDDEHEIFFGDEKLDIDDFTVDLVGEHVFIKLCYNVENVDIKTEVKTLKEIELEKQIEELSKLFNKNNYYYILNPYHWDHIKSPNDTYTTWY